MAVSGAFRKDVLENGLTLVMEKHSPMRTFSIGAWVRVGTRFENPQQNGISHFLEHMLFKGTKTRTPLEIASSLESRGGELNAFTDREYTCYHANVLSEDREQAFAILSDIMTQSVFPQVEVDREKKVLLQEMSMSEETPEDWITTVMMRTVWDKSPLGLPILGTRKTVATLNRRHLVQYYEDYYRPENVVVSVAGDIEFDEIHDLCEKYFKFEPVQRTLTLPRMHNKFRARHKAVVQNVEQLHLMLAFDGLSYASEDRFSAVVLSYYFGGGMSSRLFQEIREKAALAYNVECDAIPYSDSGLFSFYVALSHSSLKRCLGILAKELDRVIEAPLPEEEIERVKAQIKGGILMSSDYVETRQESIGRNELVFGRYVPLEEVLEAVDRVTPDTVQALAKKILRRDKEAAVAIGRRKLKSKQISLYA